MLQRAEELGTSINIREYEGSSHIWILKNNESEQDITEQGFNDFIAELKDTNMNSVNSDGSN